MSEFNFKGAIESVRPVQLEFIKNALKKKGFNAAEVVIKPLGQAGDNYMSSVLRMEVSKNGQTLKMIVKLAPDNQIMREIGGIDSFFINEHFIYSKLLPKFRELQKSVNIPEEEMYRFAECYGSSVDEPNEIVLLEDLSEEKYEMLDRFKPLSNHCVRMVLKNFAIYHSLSYVLKHQEPEMFSYIAANLKNLYEVMGQKPETRMYFNQIEQTTVAMMNGDKYKKVLKGTTSNMTLHNNNLKSDIGSKYSVIQHGDGWTNNVLFKLENDNPVSCVLIDYQLARESSPCYDIMYMIFTSTSYEQRQKHFPGFIDYYHEELDKSLNNFGLKASSVYPRDQLDADLKRYGKFMLATSLFALTFTLRKPEEADTLQETMKNGSLDNPEEVINAAMVYDPKTVALFREKMEGVVDSFLELGLIEVD